MSTTAIVAIVIACAVGVFFLVASYKIFIKKKSKEKKPKTKHKKEQKKPDEGDVKLEKKSRPPKINKAKLKELAQKDAKVEPAFSKEELEKERQEEVQKQLEKNKANAKPQNPFTFPNMPYPFGAQTTRPTMPTTPKMDFGGNITNVAYPQPSVRPNPYLQKQQTMLGTSLPKPTPIPVPSAAKEDKDLLAALKDNGTIDKNVSFGESLMITQAIDTPASKKAMNKKRNKWM